MAQPHPSHLFQPTKRPCWQCGTRHESNTMPALCSHECREEWRKRYTLAFGDEPLLDSTPIRHTDHGCNVVPVHIADERHPSTLDEQDCGVLQQLGVSFAAATAGVEALKAAVLAEQERMNAEARGVDWRPADEPQDLVDTGTCPPRPSEPPDDQLPLVDPRGMVQARQPWWKRLLGRAS